MKKSILTGLAMSLLVALGTTQDVVITCVFDGPLSGGLPKGVELYVLNDVPDLGMLGIGGANNGGGTDSVEFSFPSVGVTAGTYLYVSSDSSGFADFFGFNADFVTEGTPNAMAINGDDAIELFWDGTVIDIFGDINTDGTGQPWEYLDGWAARKPMTGPDGSTFVLGNWNYSGPDALDGATTNATAAFPVPLQTYTDTTGGGADHTVILQNLAFTPRDLTIEIGETVRFTNVEDDSEHNVNGSLETYPCNPFGFFSGQAEVGPWDFDVTFNLAGFYDYQCDPHTDFDMFGTITVVDPDEPIYFADAIANVTTEDANGVAESIGTPVTLTGVVYGGNLRPPGLLFNIIDTQGDGITVFKDAADCYEVTEGDEVSVSGMITQFNGLTQLEPAKNVEVNSTGNALQAPELVEEALSEATEGRFIRVEGINVDSVVQTGGSGWNIFGSNENANYVVRLDSDVFDNADGYDGKVISVNGLGGQFDSSEPFTDGYQVLPRNDNDIEETLSTIFLARDAIDVHPNPISNLVYLSTEMVIERIDVFDLAGRMIASRTGDVRSVDLRTVASGMYAMRVTTAEGVWSDLLVKE